MLGQPISMLIPEVVGFKLTGKMMEGGYTKGPDGKQASIYDAAMAHMEAGTPTVIFGGEQYGAGSSRDWAAKGTNLSGVKAVIAESFERIHRSNLVGMGVIPFEFTGGDTRKTLGLTGEETVTIMGLDSVKSSQEMPCKIEMADGHTRQLSHVGNFSHADFLRNYWLAHNNGV